MRSEAGALVIIGIAVAALCFLSAVVGGFFLFTTRGAAVAVPVTAPAAVAAPPSVTLVMLPDGGVELDGQWLADDEAFPRARPDERLVIAADKNVPYARVIDVMDRARDAGFTHIAFGVQAP